MALKQEEFQYPKLSTDYWRKEVEWQIEALSEANPKIKNVDVDAVIRDIIEDDYIWEEINNRMQEYILQHNNKAKKSKSR